MGVKSRKRGGVRGVRGVLAAGLVGALVASGAGVASAAPVQAWYIGPYQSLHQRGWTGEGVTIAIFESGIDLNSPDLQGADIEYIPAPPACQDAPLLDEEDPRSHGTAVAATIVGQGGDGKIQGVAPRAKLKVYQLIGGFADLDRMPAGCDRDRGEIGDLLVRAVDEGASILSLSVLGVNSATYSQLAYVMLLGGQLVIGAGNDSAIEEDDPSQFEGTLTAGAIGPDGQVTEFSGRGLDLSLVAPGLEIPRRNLATGAVATSAGTSFSTPIIAGTLALGRQKFPNATRDQLTNLLVATASGGGKRIDDNVGFGIINPTAFLSGDPSTQPDTPPFTGKTFAKQYPDYWGEGWGDVYDVLSGIDPGGLEHAKHYLKNQGMDLSAVKWLPPHADEFIPHEQQRPTTSKAPKQQAAKPTIGTQTQGASRGSASAGVPLPAILALAGAGVGAVVLVTAVTLAVRVRRRS